MLSKRVQVLFEEKDYVTLALIARGEDASVGELLRQAARKVYLGGREGELAMRQKAWKSIREWQKKVGISKVSQNYKELVDYGRKW